MIDNKNSDKGQLSRKDFMRTAGAAAGGGLLLSSLPIGASAYVAGRNTIRVAVVGCGGRGTGAASQAMSAGEDVEVVALADAFRDRLDGCYDNLSNRFEDSGQLNVPEENKFVGFDAYRNAIDLCDVVILASTPGFRPVHFEYAVEQGKHVFMEKPVATDAPGIRQVLAAGRVARQKNLNVVVGLQRHYQNNYRETIQRIHDGAMGRITSGQVYWNSSGVWMRERQPEQTEMEYQMRNWYYFTWLCGDHILEQHIHNIDVANWAIGEYPVSAQGMGGREVRDGKEYGEIFDHHFVEFTYPSGAVIASQCRHQPGCMNRVSETLQGEGGTVDLSSNGRGLIRGWDGETIFNHNSQDDPNPYQQEHDELFASIRAGEVIDDTDNGAYSTMTALMGRMATYSGQVIEWDEALNSSQDLIPKDLAMDSTPPILPDENGFYPVPVPGETEVL
ncbi:MAG: Gfo/Idh/MocA family oxidoreductase [Balneolaceae bacterium]